MATFAKFIRPETPTPGVITDRDLDIIAAILRYRFSPTSSLVRLVGGNEDVTLRRLRRLWEKGLVNRWAFPGIRTHSEFHYYLDSREPVDLLMAHGRIAEPHPAMLEEIRNNREKDHAAAALRGQHMQLGFLQHSLMISRWPTQATALLSVSIANAIAFRGHLMAQGAAPKTINRRISSVSSFYKYLGAAAAELRLPITVPNPAHAQFISRESTDARDETLALSATRARQLMGLPAGDSLIDFRDRAILKFLLYSAARRTTACRLNVADFHQDGDQATIKLHEKGDKHRTIGLHFQAAQAIVEYIQKAELKSGPLFRPSLSSRSSKLAERHMDPATMYRIVESYLLRLPGAAKEISAPGTGRQRNVYTTHTTRATAATLLLAAGVDIRKVQDLLGHRHITTTQIYDKRRRSTSESASHNMPI